MHSTRYQSLLLTGIILFCILITNCTAENQQKEISQEVTNPDVTTVEPASSTFSWTKLPLTDAVTGEVFTLDELAKQGKPVIVQTFAVWCPACSMQLRETARLTAGLPDAYTLVGLDIDPNDNLNSVKRHVEKNNFTGRYTASPAEVTRGLVETFGKSFALEIPQTIIICNQTVNLIGSGVFNEGTLKEILAEACV
ncbi:MAG TPA: redoxin family protein [Methanospirillum sp.]|nr:redoxin family protein [Methanospirillum sp.]